MKKIKAKLAQAITMIAMTMATPAYSQTSGLVTVEGNFAYPGTLWGWSSEASIIVSAKGSFKRYLKGRA